MSDPLWADSKNPIGFFKSWIFGRLPPFQTASRGGGEHKKAIRLFMFH